MGVAEIVFKALSIAFNLIKALLANETVMGFIKMIIEKIFGKKEYA